MQDEDETTEIRMDIAERNSAQENEARVSKLLLLCIFIKQQTQNERNFY